jgi:galacturan 1,4-alpha-galacturonidase
MKHSALLIAATCLSLVSNAAANPSQKPSLLVRPEIKAGPHNPGRPHHVCPPRQKNKYCRVKPGKQGHDDAKSILAAFHQCNHGGTVVLDANYTIASPLDLTFLRNLDVALTGTVNFGTNVSYWVEHSFKYDYQNSSSFLKIGGEDVNIFGHGVGLINGNGQPWYDAMALDSAIKRPILLLLDGLHGGSVTGLNMINPPNASQILPWTGRNTR